MSYVHPFSKRCDKSEIDLFRVPPTQQSLERGRWIDYAPLSSVENPDSAITYLIAGTDEYIDLSKTILTVRGEITKGDGTKLTGGGETDVAPVNNFLHSLFRQVDVSSHVPEDHPRSHAPTLAKPPKHAPKCQNPRANPAANSAKEHGPRKRRLTL